MNAEMRCLVSLACLMAILASCAPSSRSGAEPVPDDRIGLRGAGVFEAMEPPPVLTEESSPGEKPPAARAFPGAPPVIPHGVDDFLPIGRTENACVDCHLGAERAPGEPTPIPATHMVDNRRAPGRAGENLTGARWVCLSCHVARTGAAPLVGLTGAEPSPQDP
jgi:cytochrome c-type protein NapB